MLRSLVTASALLTLLAALPAAAQPLSPEAAPVAGTLRPSAGGPAVAVDLALRTGGESGIADCLGLVNAAAPDAVVEWGGGDLHLSVRSEVDATLLVHGPDGRWSCNDDAEGVMPAVHIDGAPRGRYAVWVGSFLEDAAGQRASLFAGPPAAPAALDPDGTPHAGHIDLAPGFEAASGPHQVTVPAGGVDAVASMGLDPDMEYGCSGFVLAARPSATVAWAGGPLAVTARSERDLTLVVSTPDGETLCNDDADGMNPGLVLDDAAAGRYAVWVGTFSASARDVTTDATLVLSEAPTYDPAPDYSDEYPEEYTPMPFAPATYVVLDTEAAPAVRRTLGTEDAVEGTVTVAPTLPNPLHGDACTGFLTAAPTASVTLSGDGPVALTASSDGADLVLVVRTPSGAWFCSDDADGLNPGVQVDEVESGAYLIWAGGFAETGDAVEVRVAATRGELVVSGPMDGDMGMNYGVPSVEGTYEGTELRTDGGEHSLDVIEAGEAEADVLAGGSLLNPVQGSECQGFIGAQPTATIRHRAGLVSIGATSTEDDLTLVVRTPDGRWFCSDDASGSDPEVTVDGVPDGVSAVWVGTFSRATARPSAILRVGAEAEM